LHGLPNNVIYTNPSISSLTAFILGLFSDGESANVPHRQKGVKHMETMVEKYSSSFSYRNAGEDATSTQAVCEVVLLTGTTGRLGSHLLAQLAKRPDVKTVYALNRASASDLMERQRKTFESWELDTELLRSRKIVLLTADLAKPLFGLTETIYNEVRMIPNLTASDILLTSLLIDRYKTVLQASSTMVNQIVFHAQAF